MIKIEKVTEYNGETKMSKEEVIVYEIVPDEGKCFMNKNTKHKFVHTVTHKGLPLTVEKQDLSLYEEVLI